MMCDNYDAGCSAHHIIVVMNEQHHTSTLYGAIDDLFEFNMQPAVLNMDSIGTLKLTELDQSVPWIAC